MTTVEIENLRRKHVSDGEPEPICEGCLPDYEEWPCEVAQLIAELDRRSRPIMRRRVERARAIAAGAAQAPLEAVS